MQHMRLQNQGISTPPLFTHQQTTIPEIFPQHSTKKFIEVRTGETLYLKDSGELYYQRGDKEPIVSIQDCKQITSVGVPLT